MNRVNVSPAIAWSAEGFAIAVSGNSAEQRLLVDVSDVAEKGPG